MEGCKILDKTSTTSTTGEGSKSVQILDVGFYATPKQFIGKAQAVQHPMDVDHPISDQVKLAFFATLTMDPAKLALLRAGRIKDILSLKLQLETEERKLHAGLPQHARKVMEGKKILLFKKLLEDYGYDDLGVVSLLTDGIRLTGHHELPPYAEQKVIPCASTTEQLQAEAKWRRRVLRRCPKEDMAELSELSKSEAALGFMDGPFHTEDEVSAFLGTDSWVYTPRFLLRQGPSGKLRAIDDCRRSGLNNCFLVTEQLRLEDLDYVASMVSFLGKSLSSSDVIKVALSDGSAKTGAIHPGVFNSTFCGRTLDLTKAYKQLFIHSQDKHLVVIGIAAQDGPVEFYVSRSLPFGATGSVYGFLRISRALGFLLNTVLLIPTGCYFDDFPSIQPSCLARSARVSAEALLKVLGWKFSETGEKSPDYSSTFNVLGAQLDLRGLQLQGPRLQSGAGFLMGNKPGRAEFICGLLDELVKNSKVSLRDLSVVRGHLNFASGFYAGKTLRAAGNYLYSSLLKSSWSTTSEVISIAGKIKDVLRNCPPREIFCSSQEKPILVFTDAAFDNDIATLGAVVFIDDEKMVYDGAIPVSVVKAWQKMTGKQIISQAELAAVVAIQYEMADRFRSRRIIYFIDNEAARFSLIKGVSSSSTMMHMSQWFYAQEMSIRSFPWIERVPSFSNIADMPSRHLAYECAQLLNAMYMGSLNLPDPIKASLSVSIEENVPVEAAEPSGFDVWAYTFL